MFFRKNMIQRDATGGVDVKSIAILSLYVKEKISIYFYIILVYFFEVTLMGKKLTLLRHTFFEIISIGKKLTPFLPTFFRRYFGAQN